ncbi:DUF1829 domain-containing protein [Flaviflagellibacter deserti]|uniref:DUF1829 domain-containing protein n=1 Tax=Flaviflagellibacter deserti TaxID=2267266 RepID=A0ABV9YUS1_9HYPH
MVTPIAEVQQLVDQYRLWLKDRTRLRSVHSDWVEITTPFIDRHNDLIQIYARKDDFGYQLTDDGHTLRDLELSGCVLDTPKRKSLLRLALSGFGVEEDGGTLRVRATPQNFSARKHALVQSMLAVNDLFYTASPTVRSLFREDVENWLRLADIRFVPNVQFTGKSGFQHQFDFAIPASRSAPERILKAINNPNKDSVLSFIMGWQDTSEQRPEEAQAFAFLNDNEREIAPSVLDALHQYEISPVLWSHREDQREALVA